MYTYKARIIDVYDGDTVTAIVDLGLFISTEIKVRLKGINTPEIRGEERNAGLLSKKRLEELILNKEVMLFTYKDKKEKYGRWLGTIHPLDSSKSVNEILLEEGLAVPYME